MSLVERVNCSVYWIHLKEHFKNNWNPLQDAEWHKWATEYKLNKGNI
jgi:hypothetical protein